MMNDVEDAQRDRTRKMEEETKRKVKRDALSEVVLSLTSRTDNSESQTEICISLRPIPI